MRETAIPYCRKSTNRDGRQENSIKAQLISDRNVAKLHNLLIIDEIIESASAKESNKREGFKKLMEYCESGKVDYIIIDTADRLSRDDLDSAIFMTILRSGKIKGIYVGGNLVASNDMYGQFMLWFQLGASKLDNQQRTEKVISRMQQAKKDGKVLGKVPLGYKNYIKENGAKDVKIVKEDVALGNQILKMIIEGYSLTEISKALHPLGLKNRAGERWSIERIRNFVTSSFLRGYAVFQQEEYPHKYPLIYDLKLLQEAEKKITTREYNPTKNDFIFKTKLKTEKGNPMTAYIKKGHVYYRNQKEKINLSENLLIDSFGDIVHKFEITKELEPYIKEGLRKYFKQQFKDNEINESNLKKAIKSNRNKKEKLLELFYAGGISAEGVREEQKKLEESIKELEYDLKNIIRTDDLILQESLNFIELFTNLSTLRKTMSYHGKGLVMNMIVIELYIDNKKRLKIQPAEFFETLFFKKIEMEVPLREIFNHFLPFFRTCLQKPEILKLYNSQMKKILKDKNLFSNK